MSSEENISTENETIEIVMNIEDGPLSFLRESLQEEGEDCLSVL